MDGTTYSRWVGAANTMDVLRRLSSVVVHHPQHFVESDLDEFPKVTRFAKHLNNYGLAVQEVYESLGGELLPQFGSVNIALREINGKVENLTSLLKSQTKNSNSEQQLSALDGVVSSFTQAEKAYTSLMELLKEQKVVLPEVSGFERVLVHDFKNPLFCSAEIALVASYLAVVDPSFCYEDRRFRNLKARQTALKSMGYF